MCYVIYSLIHVHSSTVRSIRCRSIPVLVRRTLTTTSRPFFTAASSPSSSPSVPAIHRPVQSPSFPGFPARHVLTFSSSFVVTTASHGLGLKFLNRLVSSSSSSRLRFDPATGAGEYLLFRTPSSSLEYPSARFALQRNSLATAGASLMRSVGICSLASFFACSLPLSRIRASETRNSESVRIPFNTRAGKEAPAADLKSRKYLSPTYQHNLNQSSAKVTTTRMHDPQTL
jgi:hypothetical protein